MDIGSKRSLMFWKKDKATATAPTGDITVNPGDFEGKDVGLFSLFIPFVKNYASSMNKTKNPAKLPYPTVFYLPSSSLMHMAHLQMAHIDILIDASMQSQPVERFLGVLKYCFSTWALTKFPYKPIISLLGETAHYSSPYGGAMDPNDKTYVLAENITKDPISCYNITNPTHGVTHQGFVELTPKFKQAHVEVSFVGQNKTTFAHPSGMFVEEYCSDIPDLIIRLLRMHQEFIGEVNISSTTGFAARISFKEKSLFAKVKNLIVGTVTYNGATVFSLDGAWDDTIFITDVTTGQRTPFFNKAALTKNFIEVDPIEKQPPTSCDRIWGEMLEALRREDFDRAALIKQQISATEQDVLYPDNKQTYVPRYFAKAMDGTWQIKDPALPINFTSYIQQPGVTSYGASYAAAPQPQI